MNEELVRKSFNATVKGVGLDGDGPGEIEARISGYGRIDSYGDVIMPGFYSDAVLADFLKRGWLDVQHNWNYEVGKSPIGFPVSAHVEGMDLVSVARFHSDEHSQAMRLKAKERLDAGLDVAVSVGFYLDYKNGGVVDFDNGERLIEWASSHCDLSDWDLEPIRAHGRPCRALIRCKSLAEFSIVLLGALPSAQALAVKAAEPISEQTSRLVADLDALLVRFEERHGARAREGRRLSQDQKSQIRELAQRVTRLDDLVHFDPEAEVRALELEALAIDCVRN